MEPGGRGPDYCPSHSIASLDLALLADFAMPRSAASRPIRLSETTGLLSAQTDDAASSDYPRQFWREAFRTVRGETERRAALLSAEDQVVQSMPDASPTKWHRAHVTWFFEEFLLRRFAPAYKAFDDRYGYLFNS
jgi:hypothetical protein